VLVTVELTFTLRGKARPKESGPVLGPAGTIARSLVGRGAVVPVPGRGKVKYSIYKEVAPTFSFPDGSSTVVLLRLPNYTAPYRLTITSFRQDVGTPELFVPSGIYLDEQFQTMGGFTEDQLLPGKKRVIVTLTFGEVERRLRYILMYTRGNLVGQHVATEGSFTGGSTPKRGRFTLSKFGLERTVRSIEAKMEIERK
jgi:hypothetical protein